MKSLFDIRHIAFLIVSVLIFGSGCNETSEMKAYELKVKMTKVEVKSSEVASAVHSLLTNYKAGGDIPDSKLPPLITRLPVFSYGTNDVTAIWNGECTNALMFVTGGGFGHWGVVVCPTNDPQRQRMVSRYGRKLEAWGDGVYFYHD
jgi:hypothetical protein